MVVKFAKHDFDKKKLFSTQTVNDTANTEYNHMRITANCTHSMVRSSTSRGHTLPVVTREDIDNGSTSQLLCK